MRFKNIAFDQFSNSIIYALSRFQGQGLYDIGFDVPVNKDYHTVFFPCVRHVFKHFCTGYYRTTLEDRTCTQCHLNTF